MTPTMLMGAVGRLASGTSFKQSSPCEACAPGLRWPAVVGSRDTFISRLDWPVPCYVGVLPSFSDLDEHVACWSGRLARVASARPAAAAASSGVGSWQRGPFEPAAASNGAAPMHGRAPPFKPAGLVRDAWPWPFLGAQGFHSASPHRQSPGPL